MNKSNRYRRLCEHDNFFIVPKSRLRLKEDNEKNAYVEPSSNNANISTLSKDIDKTRQNDPNATELYIDWEDFDGNPKKDVEINVQGKNSQEITQNIQNVLKDPNMKNVMKNGKFKATLTCSIDYRRANSIPFTKAELNEMLRR